MLETVAWLIPMAPLVGSMVCAILAFTGDKDFAQWPAVGSLGIAAIASIYLLATFSASGDGYTVVSGYNWLDIGGIRLDVSLRLDNLTLTLLTVVTTVSCLVAIYSRDYMRGDDGFARFFAVFTGFVFSMTMLVMSNNLLLMYAFWEGVGTCSYLLIGYYYRKPSAAQAAIKAFLVNRVADCAFLFGILLLIYVVGQTAAGQAADVISRLDFHVLHSAAAQLADSKAYPDLVGWIALCLLIGAIGKSAQFPLHVWLPDAMEGPTPVSALIHAATMVTAGVFLMARMTPFMVYAPSVMILMSWLGGITALGAAVMALYQTDLKRVLAYSTASQLGYLFMALGCGVIHDLTSVAVMAAMFHLVTHAFFKALLFLSAGNVMHAMGDVIDMRQFGGLRKVLPRTHILFAIGAAALAGLPPLAAFFSKDTILSLLNDARQDADVGRHFALLLGIGFVTAFLTAIYTSKAFFQTFWGEQRLPKEAGHHPHEATMIMLSPMILLAIGAVIAGGVLGPTGWILETIAEVPFMPELHGEHHEALWVMIVSTVVAILGIAIGYGLSKNRDYVPSSDSLRGAIASFGANRLYIDTLYNAVFVKPLLWKGRILSAIDRSLVDGLAMGLAHLPGAIGYGLRRFQAGLVSSYAALTMVGVLAVMLWVVWR